jgi:hypothetical protein
MSVRSTQTILPSFGRRVPSLFEVAIREFPDTTRLKKLSVGYQDRLSQLSTSQISEDLYEFAGGILVIRYISFTPIPPAGRFSRPFPATFPQAVETIFRFYRAALATVWNPLFPAEYLLPVIR